MKKTHPLVSDPLVLDAALTGDTCELVLTKKGYEAIEEALESMRATNPKATYNDVLKSMLTDLIEELEAEMN